MKAMIFAAGVGSRLKELTRDTPKCLMEVGGKTMLEHVVDRLKAAGVTGVAINVHHHADKVTRFVQERNNFNLEVVISHETTLLDTGGGLKKVASFFSGEDAFLIHNADIYSTFDLSHLVKSHRAHNAVATLAVMARDSRRGLYFDPAYHLVGWTGEESPPDSSALLNFSGISVASHEIFSHMGSEDVFSIIKTFLAAARTTQRVWGERIQDAEWTDIGTPEQLEALRKRLGGHSFF